MKRLSGLLFFLFLVGTTSLNAQMTRGQLLRKYYQITQLHNSGKDAEAIAMCEEITAVYPKLPDTYLRMAEIYYDGGESEMALVMYRTYASLEMDDKKVAGHSSRIKELEDKLGAKSLQEQEQEEFEKLMAQTAAKEAAKETSPIIAIPEQSSTTSSVSITTTATSLFDISALVSSAKTVEPEPIDETSGNDSEAAPEPQDGQEVSLFEISDIDFSKPAITAQAVTPKPEPEPEPIPEPEPEPEIPQDIQLQADQIIEQASLDQVKADCSTPYMFSPHHSVIENLKLAREAVYDSKVSPKRKFDSKNDLIGKWVSSAYDPDNGRDFIILDIDQIGSNLSAVINSESGLFLEKKNGVFKTSWNAIKSIWSSDGADFDATELKGNATRGDFSDESFDFSFSLKKKDKPNVASIGRDVMDGLSLFIPFGALASRIGSTFLNYASRKSSNEKYQTTINFSLKSVTENVLACNYVVSERHSTIDGSREMVIEEKTFHMFRVDHTYQPYSYSSNIQENALYRAMYQRLTTEAQTDINKLFPLAYMSFYGAGIGKKADDTDRISKAIVQMQKLADSGCARANAWLIPVYFNLSLDEKHYPLRLQRKRFRDLSDKNMSALLLSGNPYVYGLNGDILASSNSDPDEVATEYEKGASKNDPYALYCLGMAYKEGVIKTRDAKESYNCFRKSAELGYADAYWQLALAYKSGFGVASDYNQYIHQLFQAIDAGSIEAIDELSTAFFWGIGVGHNVDLALQVRREYFYVKNNVWRNVLALYGFPNI